MDKQIITCPKCGTKVDVSAVLYQDISRELEGKYAEKNQKLEERLKTERSQIDKAKSELAARESDLNTKIAAGVSEGIKNEKAKLTGEIRSQIEKENSEAIKTLQDELSRKTNQVKELNQAKIKIEKLEREKEEIKDAVALEKEKEFTDRLKAEREKISKQLHDDNQLKDKEKEKTINDLKDQIAELKRQADLGSQQAQGEIQELVIEEQLKSIYPLDKIEEVKKGVSGADVLQTVISNTGRECGKIYYESKRTKSFNQEWIKKLKDDNLQAGADALVIITETLPNGNMFSVIEGVYIVAFSEFKPVSAFIRGFLLKIAENNVSNANRGTKAEMLYSYLTSAVFKALFEAIASNLKELREDLYTEKLRAEKLFKKREKQIGTILTNMVGFHGSIRGIAGAQVEDLKLLEDED